MPTQTIDTSVLALLARQRDPSSEYLFGQFEATVYGGRRRFALAANSYANLPALAIQVYSVDPEFGENTWLPFTAITKNIPELDVMKRDRLAIKAADENECLREPLLKTGMFVDTGSRIRCGWSTLEVWQLTDTFVNSFHQVHSPQVSQI